MKHYDDLTIDEVMADPMIRKVMRADQVEPRQFESMLRTLASVPARPAHAYAAASFGMADGGPRAVRSALCAVPCVW